MRRTLLRATATATEAAAATEAHQLHIPVLAHQVSKHWALGPAASAGDLWVDGTVGFGGHSADLLRARPEARLLAVDRDPTALAGARARLEPEFGDRVTFAHGSYADVEALVDAAGARGAVAGVLWDLGVNSAQLDNDQRGFSFRRRAPLDMRFDPTDPDARRAVDLVNEASEFRLAALFRELGDEPFARRFAAAVCMQRAAEGPFECAFELARCLERAAPRRRRRKVTSPDVDRVHPATRAFQAIRMAVNEELEHLTRGIDAAAAVLGDGGVAVAISFHSGEDRVVKRAFRAMAAGEHAGLAARGMRAEIRTPQTVRPRITERRENKRSRSAKLRAVSVWGG